jgi:AraC family transcriptional regulator
MPETRTGILHDSPSVVVGDWECHPHGPGRSPEEQTLRTQVVLPRRGVFVRHVEGHDVVADSGQVLFFNRGQTYRVSHPVEGGDRCTTLGLAPALLREALARHRPTADDPAPRFERTHATLASDAYWRHRRLVGRLQQGPCDDLAVEEAAIDIVDAVLESAFGAPADDEPARPATRRARREAVEAARLALSARLGERVTLAGIAREAHASPYHLTRLFRRQIGVPMHRYLLRLRLRNALERLVEPGASLTEVALATGFYDHSHFTNAFRREFGVAPSRLRAPGGWARLRAIRKTFQA